MFKLMMRSFLLLSLIAATVICHAQSAYVEGDVLTMLRPGASADAIAREFTSLYDTPVEVVNEVSAPMRSWLFHFDAAVIPQQVMLRAFQGHRDIQLAQNNHLIKERSIPNDADYDQQWHHQNIDSEDAWDITTGGVTASGDTIVVAIIENANLPHPDLVANAWYNNGEIADNGIDDDGNGYVDDRRGWNPAGGNDVVYGGTHGTQVAGMIGAVGNNDTQVVGANWHVKMMPVTYASTQEAAVVASYTYPLVMRRLYNSTSGAQGAFVVATSASWGIDGGDPADSPIWCAMYDTLGTAGVLNCGATANNNVNIDVVGDMPTACPSDFMISVTATDINDQRTFSGYGLTTIDVGAPGANVVTTTLSGGIGSTSGTSFACPLTAGVIALIYSAPCGSLSALALNDPMAGALYVREALFAGVEQVGNLPGNTVTGGRINSFNSIEWVMDDCSACPTPYNLQATNGAIGSSTVSWSALPGTYDLRYRAVGSGTWTEVDDLDTTTLALTGLNDCQAYEFQVAAHCDTITTEFGPLFIWTSEGCCTAPVTIIASANDTSSATITWSTVLASDDYDLRYRPIGAPSWIELNGIAGNSVILNDLPSCADMEVQMRSSCGSTDAPWSNSVALHVPGCGQCLEGDFCTSGGNAGSEWIAHVQLGDIDRTSTADGGYADVDVTAQSTELVIGQSYPITLAPGYPNFAYNEYFTVWMDLDRDGTFQTVELVFDAGQTTTTPLNDTLHVPATATPGPVRIRVVMKYNSSIASGCATYDYGETEDYCASLVIHSGIEENSKAPNVQVYPQPADERITFITGSSLASEITLFDGTGRIVSHHAMDAGAMTLSTMGLGSGIYLYRIREQGVEHARGTFMVVH